MLGLTVCNRQCSACGIDALSSQVYSMCYLFSQVANILFTVRSHEAEDQLYNTRYAYAVNFWRCLLGSEGGRLSHSLCWL